MTGVLAGSGGTGVLEGSRPGTGVEGGGGVSAYDAAILTMGPMWYSTVSSTAPILFWPTLAEVRDGDLGDEIERGRLWFAAWWNESGNAPVTYIATADDFGPALMWYSPVDEFDPIVWPTLIEVLDGDLAAVKGTAWFAAWFADSGYAPATYELDIAETGPMWFSRLAELDAIVSWPTLDEVITGDLGSESENGRQWMAAWFSDSGNAPATYDLDVNETGPIWYSTIDELNAIATWPTLATVITGDLGAESENGHWWFAAWFLEAGQAPVTYRGDIDETGPMWFSPLDALVPETSALPDEITALSPLVYLKLNEASPADSSPAARPVTASGLTAQAVAGGDGKFYARWGPGSTDGIEIPDASDAMGIDAAAAGVSVFMLVNRTALTDNQRYATKAGLTFPGTYEWGALGVVGNEEGMRAIVYATTATIALTNANNVVSNGVWTAVGVYFKNDLESLGRFYSSDPDFGGVVDSPTVGTVQTGTGESVWVGRDAAGSSLEDGTAMGHFAVFAGELTQVQFDALVAAANADGWTL